MDEPQVVSMTAPKKRVSTWLMVVLVVFVVLDVLGAVYWYAFSPSSAIRGTRFTAGAFGERGLYELDWLGNAHTVILPVTGKLADYERSNGGEVVVMVGDDGTNVLYRLGNEVTKITESPNALAAPAVSPSGIIAFSERIGTSTPESPASFYTLSSWHLMLQNSDGKILDLGAGFAPSFFVHDGETYLLYATPTSVHFRNLKSNREQDIPIDRGGISTRYVPSVSQDGGYIALPSIGSDYALYKLASADGVFSITPIGRTEQPTAALSFSGPERIVAIVRDTSHFSVVVSDVRMPSIVLGRSTLPPQPPFLGIATKL